MKRQIFSFLFFLFLGAQLCAQTFSIPEEFGVANNTKGECLIFSNLEGAYFYFSDENINFSSIKCCRIVFNETTIDTFDVESNNVLIDSEKQMVTIKSPVANSGYLFTYKVSSDNKSVEKTAFTWITQFEKIKTLEWSKDSIYCKDLTLEIVPSMIYKTALGKTKKISRNLTISYNTLKEGEDGPTETNVKENLEESDEISINPVPYLNTSFEVIDATIENNKYTVVTDTFITHAVVAFPNMNTTAKVLHEGDEGIDSTLKFVSSFDEAISNSSSFRSSGPLLINLNSNSSELANHYEWAIIRDINAEQGDFSNAFVLFEKNINGYEVADPGLYCIELIVSNIRNDSICDNKNYACFTIAESQLNIPNAFTPNGDGKNDEFRVAYRSIATYSCHIYDQWGRKVYESDDITTGWNGYVGRKLGDIGTYFYYIEAMGTDGVEYKKKGTVNLIRTKEK